MLRWRKDWRKRSPFSAIIRFLLSQDQGDREREARGRREGEERERRGEGGRGREREGEGGIGRDKGEVVGWRWGSGDFLEIFS